VSAILATVVTGAVAGLLPTGTLVSLAALPLALQVHAGIRRHYESPYELMPVMERNVQLHLATGLLLFAGYLLAIAA